jgi:cell wall-associated NlpC family hydrolase
VELIGLFIVGLGIFVTYEGYKNNSPVEVVKDAIANPANFREILTGKGNWATLAVPVADTATGTAGDPATGFSGGGGSFDPVTDPNVTGKAATVLAYARAQIGKPYVWGGVGPNGFDCSGLTMKAYQTVGITLPHWTKTQVLMGKPVSRSQLQPGDLVFPNTGHVQLYSGGGKVVEAAKPGTKIREVPMWGFWTARRVL